MHVRARAEREPLEEIVNELGLEIANLDDGDFEIHHRVRPTTQIDRRHCQRLVHGHHEVAGAIDALSTAQCLRDRFTERDPEIFNRMVLIDVQIAICCDGQVECAMPRDFRR